MGRAHICASILPLFVLTGLGIQQPVEKKLPMVVSGICRDAFGSNMALRVACWRQG